METANVFAYGVLAALASVVGLFFFRFWRVSKDRFFVFVAATFAALASNWVVLACAPGDEHAELVYAPRLVAFVILLAGIVDKNRRGASGP